jgi:molybdopterin converting factor small subunit
MHISVHIYAYLRRYLPASERSTLKKEWDLPDRAPVKQVLERLKLPGEVRVTVLVNNSSVDKKTLLKEGDVVHIFPQMGGG